MPPEPWEFSALARLLREGTDEDIHRFLLLLRPPEIADLLEAVAEDDRARAIRLMAAPLASEVLREVQEGEREDILEDLSAAEIADIVHESKSDDAADMIGALPPDKAERALQELEAEERRELRELLEYPEDTAGGIMQTELVTVSSDATVREALDAVRGSDEDDVGEIHEVYVVDADGRLLGSLSPADLLQADPTSPVRGVAEPDPVKVPVTMDQEELAAKVREHDLAAIPVVDDAGVLLGQVLHDDVADVLEEEATEDIARMAGADPEEFYDDSVGVAVRSRAPWLFLTFLGGLGVAAFLQGAEKELQIVGAFLPLVLGMAGNVGTQTSAITVRGIALARIEFARARPLVVRQSLTGLTLGVLFGTLLFLFTLATSGGDAKLATTVGVAIGAAMTLGAVMGVTMPLLLSRLGVDPAVSTSPFVQTANDLTGAGIILAVANWIGVI